MNMVLGRRAQISGKAIIGMELISTGILFLSIGRFYNMHFKSYSKLSVLFMLLAILGISGNSMIDDTALRVLRNTLTPLVGVPAGTFLYSFFIGTSSSLWLALFLLLSKKGRKSLQEIRQKGVRKAAITGFR